MDVKKIVNGVEQTFCLPASQYVANKIAKTFYEDYDIVSEYTGTGATIKKYSKRKVVNFYDREHVQYIRSNIPPIDLGGFYWENSKDLAIYHKVLSESENETLSKEHRITIPLCVFSNLREDDVLEIIGFDADKNGKKERVKFKAKKIYLKNIGNITEDSSKFPLITFPKTAFTRYFAPTPKPVPKFKKRK